MYFSLVLKVFTPRKSHYTVPKYHNVRYFSTYPPVTGAIIIIISLQRLEYEYAQMGKVNEDTNSFF